MKYTVKPTSKFQNDLKRIQKRGYDFFRHILYLENMQSGRPGDWPPYMENEPFFYMEVSG